MAKVLCDLHDVSIIVRSIIVFHLPTSYAVHIPPKPPWPAVNCLQCLSQHIAECTAQRQQWVELEHTKLACTECLSSLQLWGKENLSYIKYLGSSWPLYFSYQLEDEEPLVPRAFHVVDGNYSVKRVANAGLVDTKPFVSDYIELREHADWFKDEVTHRAQPGDTADVNTSL